MAPEELTYEEFFCLSDDEIQRSDNNLLLGRLPDGTKRKVDSRLFKLKQIVNSHPTDLKNVRARAGLQQAIRLREIYMALRTDKSHPDHILKEYGSILSECFNFKPTA